MQPKKPSPAFYRDGRAILWMLPVLGIWAIFVYGRYWHPIAEFIRSIPHLRRWLFGIGGGIVLAALVWLIAWFRTHGVGLWRWFWTAAGAMTPDEARFPKLAEEDDFERGLRRFAEDRSRRALLVSGRWGTGKTYRVRQFLSHNPVQGCIGHAYVSLFGLSNIDRVIEEIVMQVKVEGSLIGGVVFAVVRLLSPIATLIARVTKFGALADFLMRRIARHVLIVIDDLERREKSLPLETVLGLIDKLNVECGCRAIVICDTTQLDGASESKETLESLLKAAFPQQKEPKDPKKEEEKEEPTEKVPHTDWQILQTYREKVLDVSLTYDPTIEESFRIAFSDLKDPERYHLDRLLKSAETLDLKNIRILTQARYALEKLFPIADEESEKVRERFAIHIFELTCLGRMFAKEMDFEKIPKGWDVRLHASLRKMPVEDIPPYGKALIAINYTDRPYDEFIGSYLNKGVEETDAIREALASCRDEAERQEREQATQVPWNLLWHNFQAGDAEISQAFRAVYDKYGSSLGLPELNLMSLGLKKVGDEAPAEWLEAWFREKASTAPAKELGSLFEPGGFRRGEGGILTDEVLARLQQVQNQRYGAETNFRDIARKMHAKKGWHPLDIAVLTTVTKDQLKEWMTTSTDDDVLDLAKALLMLPERDEAYQAFRKRLIETLEEIGASGSHANRTRVNSILGKQ